MFHKFAITGLSILAFLAPAFAATRTITVDDDRAQCRGAEYASLPEALSAAAPGDAILICAGSYAVPAGGLVVDKSALRLIASGPTGSVRVVPQAARPGGPASAGFIIAADDVRLEGLDIARFSGPGVSAGTRQPVSGLVLERNRIHHNQVGIVLQQSAALVVHNAVDHNGLQGIVAGPGSNAQIRDNAVTANSTAPGFTAGIEIVEAAGGVIVAGNRCLGNAVGLRLNRSSGVLVQGNQLNGNRLGLDLFASHHNQITGNEFNDNTALAGVWVRQASTGNVLQFNQATGNRYDGIFVFADAARGNSLSGNRLEGNTEHGLHHGASVRANAGLEVARSRPLR
ncbi:MAG: right-handed parallel beta-helix repeat-containing protein [Candidatus Solibacter usitatus]|nr:right-handed parallel beta-helix repeat-containing protein [Candidatus Solibacter usitatus]